MRRKNDGTQNDKAEKQSEKENKTNTYNSQSHGTDSQNTDNKNMNQSETNEGETNTREEQENVENFNEQVIDGESQNKSDVDYKEKYMRLLSEFTNYQKAKETEFNEFAKYSQLKLINNFIDILDDVELSLMQGDQTEETTSLLNMIKDKMQNLLNVEKVTAIEMQEGDVFNSELAEAIGKGDGEENKILSIVKKGYTIEGKVIRTAKVIVGGK